MTYSPSTFYDFLGITPLLPPEILRVFQNIPSDHVQVLILRRVANIIKSVLIVYNFSSTHLVETPEDERRLARVLEWAGGPRRAGCLLRLVDTWRVEDRCPGWRVVECLDS